MIIGIMTMHRVMNFGSKLQAYALQRALEKYNVHSKLIDYKYPREEKRSLYKRLIIRIIDLKDIILKQHSRGNTKYFNSFDRKFLKITSKSYDKEGLAKSPPRFDAYLSGSDQVWNPMFIKEDTSFLLSFVPNNKPKAAYASSFAITTIPEQYHNIYKQELYKFTRISVREQSGINIVKRLTGKDANLVCDPTLLLDIQEWNSLGKKSFLNIKTKYILVYVLTYMYNPFPYIYNIIQNVQKEFGDLKVIYLTGREEDAKLHNSEIIKYAGPCEFLYLIQNAEFVITTSFHGTMFSAIFGKPLYAVVKDNNDDRIPSILKKFGNDMAIIRYDSNITAPIKTLLNLKCNPELIEQFKKESMAEVMKIIDDFKMNIPLYNKE